MSYPLSTPQALRLWHHVGLAQVRDAEPDLSTRQMTILLSIYQRYSVKCFILQSA